MVLDGGHDVVVQAVGIKVDEETVEPRPRQVLYRQVGRRFNPHPLHRG
jgi:hypothetical protein